jgi:hypothetical protein
MPLLWPIDIALALVAFLSVSFSFMAALATAMFVPRLPLKPALVFALGLCTVMSFLGIGFSAQGGFGAYLMGWLIIFAVVAAACVVGALPIVLVQAILRFCRRNKQA